MTVSPSSSSSSYAGSATSEEPYTIRSPSQVIPELLSGAIHDALASEKLDQCLAIQSQSSGLLNAQSSAFTKLNAHARNELATVQKDFREGRVLAKRLAGELKDLQKRIHRCQGLIKERYPAEWQRAEDENHESNDHLDDDD